MPSLRNGKVWGSAKDNSTIPFPESPNTELTANAGHSSTESKAINEGHSLTDATETYSSVAKRGMNRDVHELGVYLADKPHPQVKVWEYLPPAGWRIRQVFLSAGTGSTFGDKNTRQVIHFCNISI